MNLEIDAGNSAIKWRVTDSEGVCHVPTRRGTLEQLDQVLGTTELSFVTEVRISCVANEKTKQCLQDRIQDRLALQPWFAQTLKQFGNLTVSYSDPSRLGVDRWLAMLAAQRCTDKDFCVIDCGSAITADRVAANGRHLGGYIVPGLRLMTRGLLGDTGQILMTRGLTHGDIGWGQDTDEAVTHGILRMAVSFLNGVLLELAESDLDYTVFLTGGDAQLMSSHVSMLNSKDLVLVPDLVMDGLAIARC